MALPYKALVLRKPEVLKVQQTAWISDLPEQKPITVYSIVPVHTHWYTSGQHLVNGCQQKSTECCSLIVHTSNMLAILITETSLWTCTSDT
jgi:hypothetical protein